jgi:hypothetical protein
LTPFFTQKSAAKLPNFLLQIDSKISPKIYPNMSEKTPKKNLFNDRSIVIPIDNIGKIDINMPEFCFGLIGKTKVEDQPGVIEVKDKYNPDRKILISRGHLGFPNQSTRDTLMVLMRLAYQKMKFDSRSTPITASEILNELGVSKGGKGLRQLKTNLDILQQTQIKYVNSFFDKRSGQVNTGTFAFSILGSYYIKELGIEMPDWMGGDDETLAKGFVTWEENFFNGIIDNAKNLISFDYAKYMSLSKDISKQLFIFLSKRSYSSKSLQLPFKELAFRKLGISQSRSLSKVKYDLKEVHQDLIELNVLDNEPEYFSSQGEEWIKYNFSKYDIAKKLQEHETDLDSPTQPDTIPELSISQNSGIAIDDLNTKQRILALNLSEASYGKMIVKHSHQKVVDSLDLLDNELKSGTKIRDPKKWLLACLSQSFDMNSLFEDRQKEIETANDNKLFALEAQEKEDLIEKNRLEIKLKSDKIQDWITQNPFEYVEECQNYASIVESSGGIMATQLAKIVKETGHKPSKIVQENKLFVATIRNIIFEKYLQK